MHELTLSSRFLDDRSERGLDIGEVVREGRSRTTVRATPDVAYDLVDDAAYQGWHTDADASIIRPARSAFRALVKQGIAYKQSVRYQNGLAVPGDA